MSTNPDQAQGPQTTASDVSSNQIPTPDTQAQPTLFQQAMQGAVQPAPTQQPTAPQPDPKQAEQAVLEQHPANLQAKVLHKVAETLSGSPQYKTTYDPQTGEATREKLPMSGKQLLLASVANILGSVGQTSSNLSARIQGRAPAAIQPLPSQQAQQQRDQMSDDEFNRVQNQKIRQAKILNSNLESMRLSFALRHEEDSALDQTIANHADDLANWNKAGAVESSKIPSSELLSKGFDKSKYLAIPDGYVPVRDKDGNRVISKDGLPVSELTYSVVDGTTQAPLTQDKYDQLAKYGLMTGKEGFKVPEGGTISSAQLALMNNKLGLIQQTQRELDEVHNAVGGQTVDLATEIKKNPKLLSALETYHNDGISSDPVQQLASLRASNNPKAQAAVGPMIALFGQDNLDKWTARTQTAGDLTADKAQSVVSDPKTDKNSPAYQKAVNFLQNARTQKAQTAADEATARTTAEAAASPASAGLAVPKGFTPNPNAAEMPSADLRQDLESKGVKVPSNFEALYAVAHNAADLKTLPARTAKGANQMDAQTGLSFIRQYLNPSYQEGDYAAASSLSKELASTRQGTAGGSLLSAGVASNHLELLDQAATALNNNDTQALNNIANSIGVQFGKSPAVTFKAIADQVNQEVGKVVAGGTPHEAELENLRKNLNSDQSPEQTQSVIKSYIGLMSGRVNEVNERSQQYFGRDVKGVSPAVARVFARYGFDVPGYVRVQVNGANGAIPKSQLDAFKKKYPNATIGGQ